MVSEAAEHETAAATATRAADVSSWHFASFRCSASIRQLWEAKRTLVSLPRGRISALCLPTANRNRLLPISAIHNWAKSETSDLAWSAPDQVRGRLPCKWGKCRVALASPPHLPLQSRPEGNRGLHVGPRPWRRGSHAGAPRASQSCRDGRHGRARGCPHSRPPSAYPPLRAGWARAPGHSGASQRPRERPKGASEQKEFSPCARPSPTRTAS